ncbi:MAG TPA: hypothetical protein VIJ88_03300 [Candidatus Paceibacterota bacterium]
MTKKITKNMNRGVERVAVMYQPYLSRTAALLAVVLAVSVFLYSVFLLEAVAHAASKTTAERQLESLNEQLSSLDGQYLVLTEALTPQKAVVLGFVTPTAITSIYAKGESGSLSFQSR